MNILGNIEIKAWIVDKNKSIRLPLYDVALAHGHILEDSVQMQEHRNKTHICKFAVMSHTLASYSRHKVATKEAKLGVVVNLFKRRHKMRSVQVARCFANYQVILHNFQFFRVS